MADTGDASPRDPRRQSMFGWKNQRHKQEEGEFAGQIEEGRVIGGKEQDHTVFCVRYCPSGEYAAVTYGNGAVRLFETASWTPVHRLRSLSYNVEGLPTTCVRWRPHCGATSADFAVSCASGAIQHWSWDEDASSDPEYLSSTVEAHNETTCIDYSPDGNLLCSAGSDHTVRVYDVLSGRLQHELKSGIDERGFTREGHTSRIFSLRFVSPHCLVSAGWETACQVWDLRTGNSERQLHGTHVCADAVEFDPNSSLVIVSSYRDTNQVRLFDYLSGREVTPPSLCDNLGDTSLYCSRLAQDQSTLYCVGSKPNSVFAIDIKTGALKGQYKQYASLLLFF